MPSTVLQSAVSANISMVLRNSAQVVGGIGFLLWTSPVLTALMHAEDMLISGSEGPAVVVGALCDQLDAAVRDAQSWLAAHRCPDGKLGAYVRGGLAKRDKAQVEAHLDQCAWCRKLAAELADMNSALRVIIAPMVLGGAATAYLAAAAASAKAEEPGPPH